MIETKLRICICGYATNLPVTHCWNCRRKLKGGHYSDLPQGHEEIIRRGRTHSSSTKGES